MNIESFSEQVRAAEQQVVKYKDLLELSDKLDKQVMEDATKRKAMLLNETAKILYWECKGERTRKLVPAADRAVNDLYIDQFRKAGW